ncbi:MAG: bacteriohemerythrin [Proteobacteria bacterium]|nr:bacteriohemerythrin [Pseudomonadota bacterium]HQR05020.1 bacteriohemerythrin [Rhodocyclaceae bacterium]
MPNDTEPCIDPGTTDTEASYGRFVPRQFLQLLGRPSILDVTLGDHVEKEMTLLFSDIRGFTLLSEAILPAENFRFINSYLSTMEPVVARHNGIIDKYIGDGIMALFPGRADDGVRSGIDMLRRLVAYNQGRSRAGYVPIRIGIGINTGLVMLGTVGGHNRMESTVIGDAVNLASRMEGHSKIYGAPLIISEHTYHSLEDKSAYSIRFLDRIRVKGRYQSQSIYEVFDADPEPLWLAKQETRSQFDRALALFHMGYPDQALPFLNECLEAAPDDKPARFYRDRCESALQQEVALSSDTIQDIRWRDEYAINISEVDSQHREMLRMFGELAAVVDQGERRVDAVLQPLTLFLTEHFATEENLMRRYAYPFAAEHGAQHHHFMDSYMSLCDEIRRADQDRILLLFKIRLTLVDWQINHITKSDYHLGHFLLRAGIN